MTQLLYTKDVTVSYNKTHTAIYPTSLGFDAGHITSLIGPSGCGKSSFLRSLNLMNREIPHCKVEGHIYYHGKDINTSHVNLYELRKSIGMVFQQPTPFNKSIRDNILLAPKKHGRVRTKGDADALVEASLRRASLWDEVKDKLKQNALALSGGQQQRLCIARTLAMNPDVVLFDEPCSALDPIATYAIEDSMRSMAQEGICIVVVTHNMEQAARISDFCAFFWMGEVLEAGPTQELFSKPSSQTLDDYLKGRLG